MDRRFQKNAGQKEVAQYFQVLKEKKFPFNSLENIFQASRGDKLHKMVNYNHNR